jgi:predicted O-linked N-acetylglucosamine transferase (SPINDLY family)
LNSDPSLSVVRTLVAEKDWLRACAQAQSELVHHPDNAQLWFLLGASRHALGEYPAAIEALRKADLLAPDVPIILNALAAVLADAGNGPDALQVMDRAVAAAPLDAGTHCNRAIVLERAGDIEAALAAYDRALDIAPEFIDALLNRGAALMLLGRYREAVENNRRLISLDPHSADAHFNLSEALLGFGQSAEALTASERAIALNPRHAKAYIDRGLALADLGRLAEASIAFEAADAIEPGALRAYLNAVAPSDPSLERTVRPEIFFLYRSYERKLRCDWSLLDRHVERFKELGDESGETELRYVDLPLAYQVLTLPLPESLPLRIARVIGERYATAVAESGRTFTYSGRDDRIRIGYLSADFREHLNAYLTLPLFMQHDRRHFEVIAYSIGPDDRAAVRASIAGAADRFVDLRNMSDFDAAARINDDGTSILVDLGGYTQHCRPGIPALRPVPVQVSYLGFPGTMGAPWIDYRLTDRIATPVNQEALWSEQLVFLPDTFFIYDAADGQFDARLSRADYDLAEDAIVYCCFNAYYKIEPHIFSIWTDILKTVPKSVLWFAGRNPDAVANLQREAQLRGVAVDRLVFAPTEPLARYKARYRLADLFLDTPIFNAMTTACDALAAGLPVLTLAGSTFTSRVAASLLSAADFPEGIVDSEEDYRNRAIEWGLHPERLRELRRSRLAHPLGTRLFDAKARVRQLETAYQEMWRRLREGMPPQSFDVAAQREPVISAVEVRGAGSQNLAGSRARWH